MRVACCMLAVLLLKAGGAFAAPPPWATLAIAVYPHGIGKQGVRHYVLRCGPPAGTVPSPALACRTLQRNPRALAPPPPATICSDISLGPAEAVVTGKVRGMRVTAHLTVRNSCEIDRWRRIGTVVPGFPGRR